MNGKSTRQKVDGWVLLDKPVGPSSTQALGRVKRIFNAAKGGHAGTLDPLASGVLPIALGEATKTLAHFADGTKEYEFTVRWGIATASDDAAQRPRIERNLPVLLLLVALGFDHRVEVDHLRQKSHASERADRAFACLCERSAPAQACACACLR